MRFVFSGYGVKDETIALYNINENSDYSCLDYESITNPSYMVEGKGYIYTYEKSQVITLHSYQIIDEELSLIDKLVIPGTNITHLVYSQVNKLLIGCSYADGTFFSIGVDQGRFGTLHTYQKQIDGDCLSRCHCVALNKEETELAVVNIALDALYLYNIVEGSLIYKDMITLPKGSGPRHALYEGDLIYVITEYSNQILIINRNTKAIIQIISTVPNFNGVTYGATLVFTSDKKYLFASNRGEDSIAKFKVLKNKTLEYIDSYSCGGKHPRHMVITSDDKYIVSCNKDSNNVTLFDTKTNKIILTIPFNIPTGVIEIK
jgi:6-phosphogluconolactonase